MTFDPHPAPSAAAARDHGMDALRTLAVLAMMSSHTARLISFEIRPAWAQIVLLLEPIIPSLFLLLVGLSLAQSFAAARRRGTAPGTWYRRQLKRAAILWAISALFFTLELGPRLPDTLTASGILANIAYAIVLVGGLLALPRGTAWVTLACAAGIVLFLWLDETGRRVFALNVGNSPFLPLWLFALGGTLWGTLFGSRRRATEQEGGNNIGILVGLGAGLLAAGLIARYGLDPLFTKPFGRSDAGRLMPAPLFGGATRFVGFYNLRPLLALCCLGLQLAALVLLGGLFRKLPERAASFGFALGRHALGAYILHLTLLALLVVTLGKQPLTAAWQTTAVWATVAVICQICAVWREKTVVGRR